MDNIEPIRRVFRDAGLYHHAADDLLCGQLADAAAPPAALAEPLFLLHTGTVYGKERGDWEIEANSGKAVDAYCDANPGKTVGLYLATQAQQPQAEPVGEWVMVPREPTLAMLGAGRAKARDGYTLEVAWEAMLAAAPDRGGA